jgi:hypothetical protein
MNIIEVENIVKLFSELPITSASCDDFPVHILQVIVKNNKQGLKRGGKNIIKMENMILCKTCYL